MTSACNDLTNQFGQGIQTILPYIVTNFHMTSTSNNLTNNFGQRIKAIIPQLPSFMDWLARPNIIPAILCSNLSLVWDSLRAGKTTLLNGHIFFHHQKANWHDIFFGHSKIKQIDENTFTTCSQWSKFLQSGWISASLVTPPSLSAILCLASIALDLLG